MAKDSNGMNHVRIGLFSGIHFKSKGWRRGLMALSGKRAEENKVDFNVIAGGLVSEKELRDEGLLPKKREDWPEFARLLAREFADVLPRIKVRGQIVKWYIVTSQVPAFDGSIGTEMAKQLAKIRDDVRFSGVGHASIWVKGIEQYFRVLVPERSAIFRVEYYSRPAQTLVGDDRKRSHADREFLFYAVGCGASNVFKPAGDSPRPYVTIQALRKLEGIHTSENQIGMQIMELKGSSATQDGHLPRIQICKHSYNFKDLVGKERTFVRMPSRATDLERKILGAIKEYGPMTVGSIADLFKLDRQEVQEAIDAMDRFPTVGLVFDEHSENYDFSHEWLQESVRYPWPKKNEMESYSLVAFGCLHAGARYTDMKFFVERLPRFLIEQNIHHLIGAGDFVEGWHHNLLQRGEVLAGLNITQQEKLSAYLVGECMARVFDHWFDKWVNSINEVPDNESILEALDYALMWFHFIKGNHDDWSMDEGHTPLVVFESYLLDYLHQRIELALEKHNLHVAGLRNIVANHIQQGSRFMLDGRVRTGMDHPYMGRMQAHSGRAQQYLSTSDVLIEIIANFHASVAVEHSESPHGQRVALQVPTIKVSSDFEYNQRKILDFGVGLLRVNMQNGKIIETETIFYDDPTMTREEAIAASDSALGDILSGLKINFGS